MKIYLKTAVQGSVLDVFSRFNKDLFLSLKPLGVGVELKRFDGCKKGDIIHLELSSILGTQEWMGEVTDWSQSEDECYFVDEGLKLPFPLKKWRHKHLITKENQQTVIIDDITFEIGPSFIAPVFYPIIWAVFSYRRPIYRRIFS